jgi:hypothetical protein
MEPSTTTLATDGRFKRSVYSVSATNVRNLWFTTSGWFAFLVCCAFLLFSLGRTGSSKGNWMYARATAFRAFLALW